MRQDATLFDTGVHTERFCHLVIVYDSVFKVLVQGPNDIHQFLWDSMVPLNLPERWSVEAVKSLHKVHEHHVQRAVKICVTVQGSGGGQRCGRCMIFLS